jgi:hypothetical protein
MAETLVQATTGAPAAAAARWRTSIGQDAVATALAVWLMIGTVLDGRSHKLGRAETFFSPWHLIVYTGFLALAGYVLYLADRGARRRRDGAVTRALPVGYGLALAGAVLFLFSGVADLGWHLAFGIEQALEAGLSPPHVLLYLSGLLLCTGPLRAAMHTDAPAAAPSLPALLPALLGVSLAAASTFFFLGGVAALETPIPWSEQARAALAAPPELAPFVDIALLGKVLVTNAIVIGFALLLLRRWRPPFGALTVLYGVVGVMTAVEDDLKVVTPLVAMVVAGLAGDALVRAVRPSPASRARFWLVAAALPAILWSAYFALTAASGGLGWSTHLWSGSIVFAALTGLGLAMLMVPPGIDPAAGRGAA